MPHLNQRATHASSKRILSNQAYPLRSVTAEGPDTQKHRTMRLGSIATCTHAMQADGMWLCGAHRAAVASTETIVQHEVLVLRPDGGGDVRERQVGLEALLGAIEGDLHLGRQSHLSRQVPVRSTPRRWAS